MATYEFDSYELFKLKVLPMIEVHYKKGGKIFIGHDFCGTVSAPSQKHKHYHVPIAIPKNIYPDDNILDLSVQALIFSKIKGN